MLHMSQAYPYHLLSWRWQPRHLEVVREIWWSDVWTFWTRVFAVGRRVPSADLLKAISLFPGRNQFFGNLLPLIQSSIRLSCFVISAFSSNLFPINSLIPLDRFYLFCFFYLWCIWWRGKETLNQSVTLDILNSCFVLFVCFVDSLFSIVSSTSQFHKMGVLTEFSQNFFSIKLGDKNQIHK